MRSLSAVTFLLVSTCSVLSAETDTVADSTPYLPDLESSEGSWNGVPRRHLSELYIPSVFSEPAGRTPAVPYRSQPRSDSAHGARPAVATTHESSHASHHGHHLHLRGHRPHRPHRH
eukprot:2124757-Pyramimonas_sp.AAC.1